MDNRWRTPDGRETELLAYYFKESNKISNMFFRIWICGGIFGMAASAVSIIKSVIEEPETAIFMIISGVLGIWLIYLFFVKFGSYIKNKALRRQLDALESNKVRICVSVSMGKESRIKRLGGSGHRARYNYYIKTSYLNNADMTYTLMVDKIAGNVLTPKLEYDKINTGDSIYIISCGDKLLPEDMFAVNINWFDEIESYKNQH